MNVSGVKLTDEQEQWLQLEYGVEDRYPYVSESWSPADQILAAVYDALPVSDE